MSTFTYAACFRCKIALDLDKYAGYADIEHYSILKKSLHLHEFLSKHAGHDTRVFTEHAADYDEMHAEGWTYQDWLTGETRLYKPLPALVKGYGYPS